MGKRSQFLRNERDLYKTPYEGILPLLPHLEPHTKYDEPFAGEGHIIRHLTKHGHVCQQASDIVPLAANIMQSCYTDAPLNSDTVISNCPWDREFLNEVIKYYREQKPAKLWLLLDADYAFLKKKNYGNMKYCSKLVAVGRLIWIEGTKMTGKDNCAWYCFESSPCKTEFVGR